MVRTKDRLSRRVLSRGIEQNSDVIVTTDADAPSHFVSSPIKKLKVEIKELKVEIKSDDHTAARIDNDTVDVGVNVVAVHTLSNADVDITDGNKAESKKRKPLPDGYICRACGEVGMHAIYECPLKVPLKKLKTTVTAADTTSLSSAVVVVVEEEMEASISRDDDSAHPVQKSIRNNKDTQQVKATDVSSGPSQPRTTISTKHVVFISGLPFSCKPAEVIAVFQSEGIGSNLSRKDVRLVMFEDSPQRCKGLAYVTFHSEDDYRMALALTNRSMAGRTLSIEVCKPNKPTISEGGHSYGDRSGDIKQLEDRSKGSGRKQDDHPASSSSLSSSSFGKKKINSRCYRCGMQHDVNQCTNKRICYRCKSTEHLSSQCPLKKKSQ